MARLFVALKLRLLANGLHADGTRQAGLILGGLVGLVFALGQVIWLASLRDRPADAHTVAVLLFTAVTVIWVFFPTLTFTADETLDPTRLTLLPIPATALMTGLLAAAMVGVGPIVTIVVLLGLPLAFPSGTGLLVALVAVLLQLALCVSLSRAVTTAAGALLRSRRGRDLALVVGMLVAALPMAGNVALNRAIRSSEQPGGVDLDAARPIAEVLQWTPPGLAASAAHDAAAGRTAIALLELLAVAAVVALTLLWWHRQLVRLLTTTDRSTVGATRGSPLAGRLLTRLVPSRRARAVLAKELRYAWRDPRRRAALMSAVVFAVIAVVAPIFAGTPVDRELLPYAAVVVGLGGGLQSGNQFGLDGSALWLSLATATTRTSHRIELAARAAAAALLVAPLVVLTALVLAAVTGGWQHVAPAVGLGWAGLGAGLAAAAVMSVWAAFPMPERPGNPFAGGNTGQGCIAGLINLGAFAGAAVLTAPLAGLLLAPGGSTGRLAILQLGPVWGLALLSAGVLIAAERLEHTGPELLVTVSALRS